MADHNPTSTEGQRGLMMEAITELKKPYVHPQTHQVIETTMYQVHDQLFETRAGAAQYLASHI